MPKYANKRDSNHSIVVETIEKIGYEWIDCVAMPSMGCDGLALRGSVTYFVEIKDGSLMPSRRKLTDGESARMAMCQRNHVPYLIVISPEDAIDQMGRK